MASFAIVIMILFGVNFDLRINRDVVPFEDWVAYFVAQGAYHFAIFGLLFALLGAVPQSRPVAGGARDGQGHLDGVHHPDRLASC